MAWRCIEFRALCYMPIALTHQIPLFLLLEPLNPMPGIEVHAKTRVTHATTVNALSFFGAFTRTRITAVPVPSHACSFPLSCFCYFAPTTRDVSTPAGNNFKLPYDSKIFTRISWPGSWQNPACQNTHGTPNDRPTGENRKIQATGHRSSWLKPWPRPSWPWFLPWS